MSPAWILNRPIGMRLMREVNTKIAELISSARDIDPKVIRFVLVGGANTAMTLLIYAAVVLLGWGVSVAVIVSACCGIAFSSILNSRYTFERKSISHSMSFFGVYVITVGLNIVILNHFINEFSFHRIYTQVFLVPFFAVLTFILLKLSDRYFFSRADQR